MFPSKFSCFSVVDSDGRVHFNRALKGIAMNKEARSLFLRDTFQFLVENPKEHVSVSQWSIQRDFVHGTLTNVTRQKKIGFTCDKNWLIPGDPNLRALPFGFKKP